jgi:RNA polymerase sigma factor (TIGR02999 family)
MRRILVNHAHAKKAQKRGGDAFRVTLHEPATDGPEAVDVLILDQALGELQAFDERKSSMLELYYFGGLTYRELAEFLEVAESTVYQDLRTARAWLNSQLGA